MDSLTQKNDASYLIVTDGGFPSNYDKYNNGLGCIKGVYL